MGQDEGSFQDGTTGVREAMEIPVALEAMVMPGVREASKVLPAPGPEDGDGYLGVEAGIRCGNSFCGAGDKEAGHDHVGCCGLLLCWPS